MTLQQRLSLLFISLLLIAVPARAADTATTATRDHVRASLIVDSNSAQRGGNIQVGLYLEADPHWHSYWRNPGDSGLPTRLIWELPAGVTVSAIQWPLPAAIPIETLLNYGFSDGHLLSATLTVEKSFAASELSLPVTAKWLICNDVCIPQKAQFTLSLPVTDSHPKASENRKIFQQQALPEPGSNDGKYTLNGKLLRFQANNLPIAPSKTASLRFFVDQRDTVDHAAAQMFSLSNESLGWEIPVNAFFADEAAPSSLSGLLLATDKKGQQRGYRINFEKTTFNSADWALPASENQHMFTAKSAVDLGKKNTTGDHGKSASISDVENSDTGNNLVGSNLAEGGLNFGLALLLALLGGAILNLMPCVFPVLSIKLISLAESRDGHSRQHALAYGAGVIVSFVAIAALLLALRAGGAALGWGFQLQSPVVVAGLAYLLFALGLSLSGVALFGQQLMGVGENLTQQQGQRGAFFTGVLAVVVASPCTAPFMGTALGWAIAQPAAVALLVFAALGLGMAVPFVVLAWWPKLTAWLPKPGAWMETFKQVMAFPLYLTVVWLFWVLGQQVDIDSLGILLLGLVALAFAVWAFGLRQQTGNHRPELFIAALGGIVAAAISLGTVHSRTVISTTVNDSTVDNNHQSPAPSTDDNVPYSAKKLEALIVQNQPVLIDMTAAWCITCQVNKRRVLSKESVREALAAKGITMMVGDWTNRDPEITRFLETFNRSGVPLYVLFNRSGKAKVLPQVLSLKGLLQEISNI